MSFSLKNMDHKLNNDSQLLSQAADIKSKIKNTISCVDLIDLFNGVFLGSHDTCLIGGADEPEYRPADTESAYHRIIFRQDYVSSALHEVAHWCIAGQSRRLCLDYGYWYVPDGRSQKEQSLFEQVERKPQALEWIFSRAAGVRFRVSEDNLDIGVDADGDGGLDLEAGASIGLGTNESSDENTAQSSLRFKQGIVEQAQEYCLKGLNERAERFLVALYSFSNGNKVVPYEQVRLRVMKPEYYCTSFLQGFDAIAP